MKDMVDRNLEPASHRKSIILMIGNDETGLPETLAMNREGLRIVRNRDESPFTSLLVVVGSKTLLSPYFAK